MKESTKANLRKLRWWIGLFRNRFDRGMGLISQPTQLLKLISSGAILFIFWNQIFPNYPLPTKIISYLAILFIPVVYFLGWLDQEKLKLAQVERSQLTKEFNFFFQKMERDIKYIKENINQQKNESFICREKNADRKTGNNVFISDSKEEQPSNSPYSDRFGRYK